MATVNLYVTKPKYLPQIPVRDGNIIFTSDASVVGFDYNGSRMYYNPIKTFDTEEDRLAYSSPIDGYYIVKETHMFWSYSNCSWTKLVPDNIEPLYFAQDSSEFPETGNPTSLYIADGELYKWDKITQKYLLVANATIWRDFEDINK